ncbi:hypothetical protein FOCC_FOCC008343 [Frankliniella occidentalis]|uniref:Uncharacterized protein LOC127749744 n=1 Tax=Frankliniella occidentalis TaxID=133901 RepID=A0A9C6WR76_FRAOC|nr:uncharacterized protein LOC127749744 [Frankliniella occidentalis]KAE8745031.1 hypothetical protein FOCC_FOCC008343 [Frankliniella occidentalis]
MGKPASNAMRVCGHHFLASDYFPGADQKKVKRLKLTAIPSQNLPVRQHDKVLSVEAKEKQEGRSRRREKRAAARPRPSSPPPPFEEANLANNDAQKDNGQNEDDAAQSNEEPKSKDVSCQRDPSKCDCKMTEKPKEPKPVVTVVDVLSDKEKLKNFTGLHSFELLEALVTCVSDLIGDKKDKKEMCLKHRIILVFIKLKLNLSFTSLSILMGVCRQTCSNYFKELVPLLRIVLETMISWPDHEVIRSNMPIAFKNYRNTRIVLDCAETPIEKSKCLKCRILTWSNYKGRQTAKFDVGVAPSGLITHISQTYGGRASDKLIVNDSGILDKLIYQDAVMADKGFKIEQECLMRNLILHRPPFVYQKKQMIRAEALRCAEIARARVHVERVFM